MMRLMGIALLLLSGASAQAMPVHITGTILSWMAHYIDQDSNPAGTEDLLPSSVSFTGSFDYNYDPSTAGQGSVTGARITNLNVSFADGSELYKSGIFGTTGVTPDSLFYWDASSIGFTWDPPAPSTSYFLEDVQLEFYNPPGTSLKNPDTAVNLENPDFNLFVTRSLTIAGRTRHANGGGRFDLFARIDTVTVPEPGALGLMGLGLAALVLGCRRRRVYGRRSRRDEVALRSS
jgi:hypothetical protein